MCTAAVFRVVVKLDIWRLFVRRFDIGCYKGSDPSKTNLFMRLGQVEGSDEGREVVRIMYWELAKENCTV